MQLDKMTEFFEKYQSETTNIPDKQRLLILALVIESNLMTKHEVMSHLSILIDQGSKIEKWESAVYKWKSDRQYVSEYKKGLLSQIIPYNL